MSPPPLGRPFRNPNPPTNPNPTPIDGSETPAPPVYTPTAAEFATLRTILTRYGLISLYDRAVEWMVSGIADSPERLEIALRETTEFQERFAGMFIREREGYPPISVDTYLAWENQAFQLAHAYGFPPGFYDEPADFARAIGNNLSLVEWEQRLAGYAEVASLGRETVRQALSQHMGEAEGSTAGDLLTDGDIAAWFADPERGLQAIRARVRGAEVSAAAMGSGFGALTAAEALRVGNVMDEGGAQQAFAELARRRELFEAQAGEEGALGRDVAIGAAVGEAGAVGLLEQQTARRRGQFQRGGEFASGQEGFSGLGSS